MLTKSPRQTAGYSAIEVFVVILIVIILVVIAVPGIQKARKRSQAAVVLNEARALDTAKEQYAEEYNQPGSATVTGIAIKIYLKPGTRLYESISDTFGPTDIFERPYVLTTFDQPVKVNPKTVDEFSEVIVPKSDFWGVYK